MATSSDFTFTTTAAGGPGLLTNLISMWKLDESSATANRADSHGSNTLTTLSSVAVVTGKIGNAADFPGDGNRMTIASNSTLQGGEVDYTFACWVKLDSKSASGDFASKAGSGGSDEYIIGYDQASDRFRFTVQGGGSYTTVLANTVGSPAVGTWYLVVAWHDQTAQTINIQVNNGTPDSVARTSPTVTGSDPFTLGSYGNGAANYLHGVLDEVAFWKPRLLGATDRSNLWNSGAGAPFSSWT